MKYYCETLTLLNSCTPCTWGVHVYYLYVSVCQTFFPKFMSNVFIYCRHSEMSFNMVLLQVLTMGCPYWLKEFVIKLLQLELLVWRLLEAGFCNWMTGSTVFVHSDWSKYNDTCTVNPFIFVMKNFGFKILTSKIFVINRFD